MVEQQNSTIAALSENLKKTKEAHKKEVDALNLRINELTAQVVYLDRQLFGRKSEKLQAYDRTVPTSVRTSLQTSCSRRRRSAKRLSPKLRSARLNAVSRSERTAS